MTARRIAIIALSGLTTLACKQEPKPDSPPPRPAPEKPVTVAQPSWYRAALQAPDGELVFLLGLPAPGTQGTAILQSGADRVERPARWDGSGFHVEFPVYQTSLYGDLDSTGVVRGAYELRSGTFGHAKVPLIATPIAKPEVAALVTVGRGEPIDLGERKTVWKLALTELGTARLELEQLAAGDFHATLSLPTGNHTYLAGNGRDNRIVLSAFDGARPSRMTLELDEARRSATGEWLTNPGLDWRERLTAERTAEVPLVLAQPKAQGSTIKLPQLADLVGKPVILELAGSWCSSCKNAAPVLRRLHDEHAARGLAIVTLLYEFTEDTVANREQAEVFKTTYDIPWKVEAVDGTPEDIASIMPPGLEKIETSGFPIALFLDRTHKVVGMHAGFPVESAPDHAEAVAAYRKLATEILQPK